MQKHSNLSAQNTRVIALRIPKQTYVILLKRSKDWEMSISSLIREMVIRVFNDNDKDEANKIKPYKKRWDVNDRGTRH